MRSKVVGAFVLMLWASFASNCFPSTDLCKGYAVKKEYDKAIEECTKQINGEIAVKYPEFAYSNRGAAYAAQEQYDKAISDYTKAIELNPGYFTAYYNRAIAFTAKQQYDEAVSDFTKVIELSPGNSTAYIGRATAFANKGQYDEAISDFNKAIELNPGEATAYYNRAITHAKKKQYDQAASDYNKAVELSVPTSSPVSREVTSPPSSSAVPAGLTTVKQAGRAIYHVQLGAFKNKDRAMKLAKQFRKKGYDAYVIKSPVNDKGMLYRVLVGRDKDKRKSEKLLDHIRKKEKITPIIFSE